MDHDGRHGARCFIRRDRHHATIRADAMNPARRQRHASLGVRIAPRGTHHCAVIRRERRAVGLHQRDLRTRQTPAMRIEPDRGRCPAIGRLSRVDERAHRSIERHVVQIDERAGEPHDAIRSGLSGRHRARHGSRHREHDTEPEHPLPHGPGAHCRYRYRSLRVVPHVPSPLPRHQKNRRRDASSRRLCAGNHCRESGSDNIWDKS